MLTFDQIKELIDLVSERKLESLEIERSGFRLKIGGRVRPSLAVNSPAAGAGAATATVAAPIAGLEPAAAEPAEEEGPAAGVGGLAAEAHILKSPIVGTFYAAPSADGEPYARVGDRVKQGQVLCIVEAMKLMNEIESDVTGSILEIFPENAQPVEFGEPLFAILPA